MSLDIRTYKNHGVAFVKGDLVLSQSASYTFRNRLTLKFKALLNEGYDDFALEKALQLTALQEQTLLGLEARVTVSKNGKNLTIEGKNAQY